MSTTSAELHARELPANPVADRPAGLVTPEMSIYLDAVRFLAALAVLVGHLDQDGLHAEWMLIGRFSHEAVVIFFVLSGLVITHSTPTGGVSWRTYAVARLARLYSVVIPAIVLSFVVKGVAAAIDPVVAAEYLRDDLNVSNVLASVLFLNESWGMSTTLPWNGPYWSLCYEAWYYVIFGVAMFAPTRHRLWVVTLVCLIVGPAILLLFPLWLLGAYLARQGMRWVPPQSWALLLWPATLIAGVVLHASGLPTDVQQWLYLHVPGYWRLNSAQRFVTDYVYGLLVALNFLSLRALEGKFAPVLRTLARPVQWLAGYTFSLYLFHRPLTEVAGHFFPNLSGSRLVALAWLLAIAGACMMLGMVTEGRKREARALVTALLDRLLRR